MKPCVVLAKLHAGMCILAMRFASARTRKLSRLGPGELLFYIMQILLPAVFFTYDFHRQFEGTIVQLIYSAVKDTCFSIHTLFLKTILKTSDVHAWVRKRAWPLSVLNGISNEV